MSGTIFANYQYRTAPASQRSANRFEVERAYVTVRASLGPRTSVRVTADVFQRDTGREGWPIRAKYAYIEHRFADAWSPAARLGLIQTVVIEHDEGFWPRWISTVPTDRHGYFSSADGGAAVSARLPGGHGEIYATVTNGPGFSNRETDRFKDAALRVTLTPRFSGAQLALSGWGYKGARASKFADGGAGQVGPIRSSLRRDRWGALAIAKRGRHTGSAQWARRDDERESGANTLASPRALSDSAGSLASAYVLVGPASRLATWRDRLGAVARVDRIRFDNSTGAGSTLWIAGVTWHVTQRFRTALDLQDQQPRNSASPARARTFFLHLAADF